MKYVVLDLDGVVYNFGRELRKSVVSLLGDLNGLPAPVEWDFPHSQWGLTEDEYDYVVTTGVLKENLFWEGDPLPGAREGWDYLSDRDDVYIHVVTNRRPVGAIHEAECATRFWLARNRFDYDKLSITKDKVNAVKSNMGRFESSQFDHVITVEDNADNWEAYKDEGYQSLLVVAPWNSQAEASHGETILSLAGIAQKLRELS